MDSTLFRVVFIPGHPKGSTVFLSFLHERINILGQEKKPHLWIFVSFDFWASSTIWDKRIDFLINMANTSASPAQWREYFRSANSDIFYIIEHAIVVAASDCPREFKLKRDRIAELLFACKANQCYGCDTIQLAVPNGDGLEKSEDEYKSWIETGGSEDAKESKVNSSSRDDDDDNDDDLGEAAEMNVNQVPDYSYGDRAEALIEEVEEEYPDYEEVLRIKEILDKSEEESESMLFDYLRKHQLMSLSAEDLKVTGIEKSVDAMRKHGSGEIRNPARTLTEGWKAILASWISATAAVAGAEMASESVKTSAVEEEHGPPSPTPDEGAFFAAPTSMELPRLPDGLDDDGNPRKMVEFNKNRESSRKPSLEKKDTRNWNAESPDDSCAPLKDKVEQMRNTEPVLKKQDPESKPNRPPGDESGSGRPKPRSSESSPRRKANNEDKIEQKSNKGRSQKKLRECHKEAENTKRQHMTPGNHSRNSTNGR